MREFCTKWWKRIATVDMLFIGVLTLLASLFASWLKQFTDSACSARSSSRCSSV